MKLFFFALKSQLVCGGLEKRNKAEKREKTQKHTCCDSVALFVRNYRIIGIVDHMQIICIVIVKL